MVANFWQSSIITYDGQQCPSYYFSARTTESLRAERAFELAADWCRENIRWGDVDHRPRWDTRVFPYRIVINDEASAVAFKLRWC